MMRMRTIIVGGCVGLLLWFVICAQNMGCSSGVGQTTGGGNDINTAFNNCYDFGVSRQSADDLYQTVLNVRAGGFSLSEVSQIVIDTCPSACYYEPVCSNGCTSCSLGIVNAAYNSKSVAPPTGKVDDGESLVATLSDKIRVLIKNK